VSPQPPVGFYPTFSPVSVPIAIRTDGYFLLHCYPFSEIFLLGSTVPCVARTFLPDNYRDDKAACRCKDKKSSADMHPTRNSKLYPVK